MSKKEVLESIDRSLNGILKLLAEDKLSEKSSVQDKVKKLYKMGFNNGEMAEIIGTSKSSVSGSLSHLRSDGEIDD